VPTNQSDSSAVQRILERASDPYRWVRNPVAAWLAGAIFGLSIALSSTGIALMFLLGLPLAHMQVVLLEEPLLRKRFGSSYEAYVHRVPRWIPRSPRSRQT
jgi:protein-S-isoprenylcysteine O-methyltransferase Ste14